MKKSPILTLCILLLIIILSTSCGSNKMPEELTVTFYNTENFFDTIDNPDRRDEEYLPEFKVPWNTERYQKKLRDIATVIAATDSLEAPVLVGLAEIENRKILTDLISTSPLSFAGYRYVMRQGRDKKGLDVALLYRESFFQPLKIESFDITTRKNRNNPSRPVLYVLGLLGGDSLHVFVNQWPSRWLGKGKTERGRVHAALRLKEKTDMILKKNPRANIIVMGDFNDNPIDPSLLSYFNADLPGSKRSNVHMYNMQMEDFYNGKGSYFNKQWYMYDQLMVSSALIDSLPAGWKVSGKKGGVFDPQWLMYFDEGRRTWRPLRSKGRKYYGGASSHLPVYIRLQKGAM